MFVYFDVFNLFFEEALPPLFNFFSHIHLNPDLYLIGWYAIVTLKINPVPRGIV